MDRFKGILEGRLKTYNEKYHWTAIHRPREKEIFYGPKIVVPYRAKKNIFGYNEVEWFCRSDVYIITEKEKSIKLKYLLALLNSKLYYLWLYFKGKRKGEILELFQVPLSEISIPSISIDEQDIFVNIINEILNFTEDKNYLGNTFMEKEVDKLKTQIDELVYKLFQLTEEEIVIIEEHYERKI